MPKTNHVRVQLPEFSLREPRNLLFELQKCHGIDCGAREVLVNGSIVANAPAILSERQRVEGFAASHG